MFCAAGNCVAQGSRLYECGVHLPKRKIRRDYSAKTLKKMKTSRKTLFTIIVIISLSVLLPCGAIVLDFAFANDFTKCLSLIMCLTGYNFFVRTIIGQTVTFFLRNKNHFNLESAWLRPKKFEKPLYRFLKVKKWKKHAVTAIPEQFDLENLPLETVVKNMIQAELVHLIIIFAVLIPILFARQTVFPCLVVIGSVFSAVWDMQYVILQRYNRPKIVRLMKDLKT